MKNDIKQIYVYLFNGFADWEIAYLQPNKQLIKDYSKCQLIYISDGAAAVRSMNGLNITPDMALENVDINDVDMLVLPGGEPWMAGANQSIIPLADAMVAKGKPVAAICAATMFAAQRGYLNNVRHTSNALMFLKAMVPDYKGDQHYIDAPAVADGNTVTAGGSFPVDFTREIYKTLGVFADSDIEKWYQLFKNGIWTE